MPPSKSLHTSFSRAEYTIPSPASLLCNGNAQTVQDLNGNVFLHMLRWNEWGLYTECVETIHFRSYRSEVPRRPPLDQSMLHLSALIFKPPYGP